MRSLAREERRRPRREKKRVGRMVHVRGRDVDKGVGRVRRPSWEVESVRRVSKEAKVRRRRARRRRMRKRWVD